MNISIRKKTLDILEQHIEQDYRTSVLKYLVAIEFQEQLLSIGVQTPKTPHDTFDVKIAEKIVRQLVRVNLSDNTVSLKHSLLVAQSNTKDVVNTDTPYASTFSDLISRLRKEYGFNSKGHPYNQQDYTIMSDSKPNAEQFKRVIAIYSFEEILLATAKYYSNNKSCKTIMRFFEEKIIDEVIADMSTSSTPDNAV